MPSSAVVLLGEIFIAQNVRTQRNCDKKCKNTGNKVTVRVIV